MIERTLGSLERHFNSTVKQLVSEAKISLRKISNTIHTPAFKDAIDGLPCHFNGNNTNMTSILMMAKQKFNSHLEEEGSEERTRFVKEVLYESITKKLLQTITDLLNHFKPDGRKIIAITNKLKSGKNSKLEHLILRTLEEVQTDRFLQHIDLFFKDICQKRRAVIGTILQTIVENLWEMLSMHTYSYNFRQIFGMLLFTEYWEDTNFDFEPLGKIFSDGLDAIGRTLKDELLDEQIIALIYNLALPDCDSRPE